MRYDDLPRRPVPIQSLADYQRDARRRSRSFVVKTAALQLLLFTVACLAAPALLRWLGL